VAHFFGTDVQADVYFASMAIVLSLVFLVKELIYPSVLPVFAGALKTSFSASAALFKRVFIWLITILLLFALIMILFSDNITAVLVPGFSEEKLHLTSSLLRYLVPGGVFLCMATLTYAALNCRRNFLKAAIPEALLKLIIAVGLILLVPTLGIYALAVVVTIGSAMVFIIQFLFIPEGRVILSKNLYKPNSEFKNTLVLMGPLILGVVFSHISGLVDNVLASTLPTGHLSFLGYSKKLIDAILLVGPVALVTVVYAHLSHLNAEGKHEEFKALFIKVLRLIIFISIPSAFVLVILRVPIVTVLFERGKFTAQSTSGTAQALLIYGIGIVTFAVEALVVYGFYALSNTKIPVRAGIFGVLLDVILAVSFVKPFGFAAIAWAYVFSKTVKVVILLLLMDRKIRFLYRGWFISYILKVTASCLISALCMYLLKDIMTGDTFLQMFIFNLVIPLAGFAITFLLCCHLLRLKELNYLFLILMRRKSLKLQLVGSRS